MGALRAASCTDSIQARELPGVDHFVLLPEVRIVLVLGGKAQAAWTRACIPIPALMAPHPSPRTRNLRPAAGEEVVSAICAAHRVARFSAVVA